MHGDPSRFMWASGDVKWSGKGNPEDGSTTDEEILKFIQDNYSDSLLSSALTFANDCHDEATGRFCDKPGHPQPSHTDRQIKDLQDMISQYEGKEGSETVVDILKDNLKNLRAKKASGAAPYHGADLYKDPRLVDDAYEQEVKDIRATMDIIASVHEPDPSLQPVRISYDPALKGGLGVYKPAFNTIGVQDTKDRFSMIHELGHWQTLNPNFDLDKGTNPTAHFLGNVNKLGLGNVFYRITQSKMFNAISQTAAGGDGYAAYLASPHEAYARAYAQYIATKSNDPRIMQQFKAFRAQGIQQGVQWGDQDFAPIAKAFDEHFAGLQASAATEQFYNQCHNPTGEAGGQFCSDNIDTSALPHTYAPRINRVAKLINSVHQLPADFPKATVIEADTGNADGSYFDKTIKLAAHSDNKEVTFVHEFGHHLSLSAEGNFSPEQFDQRVMETPTLRKWKAAVEATPTYENLRSRFLDHGEDYAGYLKDERELFARSYAQYITRKTNDSTLTDQMERIRSKNRDFQWPDEEFGPIAEALEAHLASQQFNSQTLQFANDCHDPATGQFCETGLTSITRALNPRKTGWTTKTREQTLAELNSTEEGRTLAGTLDTFQNGTATGITRLRNDLVKHGKGIPTSKRAEVFLRTLNGVQPITRTLYRGARLQGTVETQLQKFQDRQKSRQSISLNVSSFSESPTVADLFAQTEGAGHKVNLERSIPIIIELKGPKKAIPLENLAKSRTVASEEEWITAGKFKILAIKKVQFDLDPAGIHLQIEQDFSRGKE